MFDYFKNWLFGGMRRQFIVGTVLTNAVIMSLFVWELTQRQQALLIERGTEYATALAQSIATSTAGWLAARDFYGMQEIIDSQKRYPELRFAMILDLNGRILAHSDSTRLNQTVRELPVASSSAAGNRLHIFSHTLKLVDVAVPVVLGERQIGWVRLGIDQQSVSARLDAITLDGVFYTLGAILIGLLLTSFMAIRLTRRLESIQHVADAVQLGDHASRVELRGNDEASHLAAAFNTMLDALAQRETALQASEQMFRKLVDTSPLPTLVISNDEQSRVILMNRRFTELFGYTLQHVSEVADWWPLAYPEAEYRAQVQQLWQQHIEDAKISGRAFIQPVQARVSCLDGSLRHIEFHMAFVETIALIVMNDLSEHKAAEAELQRYRLHLEELVAERTTQLAQARDAAEAANRAKSLFLANMSHELRTPLNAILGFAQIMERDPRMQEKQRDNLHIINKSGQHLLALINDILEIARIEAGRLSAKVEACDLRELLHSLTDVMTLRAQGKGLALRLDIAPDLPAFITTDIGKLRQILLNLLSNAIKYTEHGTVVLRVACGPSDQPALLVFEVEDSGVGIEAENSEKIFQPFFQAEYGISLGEGTGLGLSICREYTRLLGGNISVSSTPGQGSLFRLTLPLVETSAAPAPSSPPKRLLGLAPGQPEFRVLIVEDDQVNRNLLRTLLEEVGFRVHEAKNGQEAIELFTTWKPHFIWMDMRMPVMDGLKATRIIRGLPGGNQLPIVALTASAFEEERAEILAAGCNDVLAKPLEENKLFAIMAALLPLTFSYTSPPEIPGVPKTENVPVDLGLLPAPLRLELLHAAEALDLEATRALIQRIRQADTGIANRLEELLKDYHFDRIISLCRDN